VIPLRALGQYRFAAVSWHSFLVAQIPPSLPPQTKRKHTRTHAHTQKNPKKSEFVTSVKVQFARGGGSPPGPSSTVVKERQHPPRGSDSPGSPGAGSLFSRRRRNKIHRDGCQNVGRSILNLIFFFFLKLYHLSGQFPIKWIVWDYLCKIFKKKNWLSTVYCTFWIRRLWNEVHLFKYFVQR